MKKILKIVFVFLFSFSILFAMSSKKVVHGRVSLTGNEPFTYYIIECDNGEKFILEGDRNKLYPFQTQRVVLTYMKTDQKKMFPIVKVIQIKLAE